MATQLTLISLPSTSADPATTDAPVGPARGDAPVVAHRRSVDHTGWLDRRTISTGRKGIARARAALADATRRAAAADAEREAVRDAALAEEARWLAEHPGHRGHAA